MGRLFLIKLSFCATLIFISVDSMLVNAGDTCSDSDQVKFSKTLKKKLLDDRANLPEETIRDLDSLTFESRTGAEEGTYVSEISNEDASSFLQMSTNKESWFVNSIYKQESSSYFANDLVNENILRLQSEGNLPKVLPKSIAMNRVTNAETVRILDGIQSGTEDFATRYSTTPLGKLSNRIAASFGLEVTDVEIIDVFGNSVNKPFAANDIIRANVRPLSNLEADLQRVSIRFQPPCCNIL